MRDRFAPHIRQAIEELAAKEHVSTIGRDLIEQAADAVLEAERRHREPIDPLSPLSRFPGAIGSPIGSLFAPPSFGGDFVDRVTDVQVNRLPFTDVADSPDA